MLGFAKSPQFFYKANTAVAVDTLYSIKYTLETASLLGPQTIATGIWVSECNQVIFILYSHQVITALFKTNH